MKKRLLCILLSICLSFQISILYENNVLCSSIKTYAADSADIASMNPIEQTYSFIKKFEGCATTCFWDNSQWTIGIGNKCPYNHSSKGTYWHEKGGHTISEEDAHTLFFTEMPEYVSRLKANCKGLYVTQNQFDVLLSGTYNHGNVLPGGCSKCGYIKHPLIQYLYGNYTEEEAREASYVWCINKGTKDEKGLRTRRIEEADHFFADPPVPKGYVMSESEGAGQTIPDGDYWILSALSRNFWVDIPGDEISKNGENVTTYIREVNEVPSKYDAWTVTYLNNGYYKIKQKDTDLCLDVADASLYAGTNVQIVNDNGAPAQQWSIIPTQTGYKLQSRCNSFVLDVTNGIIENNTNIMVWESNEQRTQRFGFIPYGTDEDRVVKDGTYQINSKVSDAYCIDASGEGAKNEYHNGTDIHLWTNDSDDVFKITYAGDGYYKIQEVVSGLYVEVINAGSILDTQTNVQLYEGNNSLGQYWKIRKNSNGSYTFVSKLSGYNLDLEDGKATQGQNISQHFNNDAAPQQWTLKPVGYVMSESEGAGQTIPDGDYWILSALSRNFWVDIPGDEISKNGENVTTYIREVNEVPSKYDAWTVTYLNNGYYKIKQKDTDLCLDVADASLYAGTNVQIVNDNGAPAQQWSIIPTQTGYKLQSRCNSFVLDVTNGIIENNTNIMVWESNEQRTQRFGFIPYGTDEDRVVKDGTYQINSKVSDAYCIDASGEGAKNEYHNGTDIHLWTNDSDDVFKITYAGDGYYKIQEVVSGLYVEVINAGSILDTQTNVQLYEGNNSLGQYWKIRKNSNGSYTFVSKLSGYNLDLEDGKATQGQNISQHFNNDSTAQQWTLKNTNNDVEGDCNNDGKFTIADIVMLQKWLLNDGTVLDNWKAADLYEDDMLNVFDLALMKQMIANAE